MVSTRVSTGAKIGIPQELLASYSAFEQHFNAEIARLRASVKPPIDTSSCNNREREGLYNEMAVVSAARKSQEQKLKDFMDALARLEAGTLGICENCHTLIDPERIRAYPHVRYCKACQEERPANIW